MYQYNAIAHDFQSIGVHQGSLPVFSEVSPAQDAAQNLRHSVQTTAAKQRHRCY